MKQTLVDHIPVIWTQPNDSGCGCKGLVVWLPGFSGTKEETEPQLRAIAAAGFIAVSFDPYQHGERRIESLDELRYRIAGNIRRNFWPILALTAEEFPRILDWAEVEFGHTIPFMAGGISMGGDISVVAAAVDQRICAAVACIATPDWMRPGSHESPGQADDYAQKHYKRCNPLTNLDSYEHCPAISFQCGAMDTQVPTDGADRFVHALKAQYEYFPQRLEVVKHSGVSHQFTETMLANAISWFKLYSDKHSYPN
jgi:uncharacterized protein